jgi:hypothetical protein
MFMSPEEDDTVLLSGVVIDNDYIDDKQEKERSEADPSTVFLEKLKNAYTDFFEKWYEPMLSKDSHNEIIYPSIKVSFDDDQLELIFDFDLFEQMFDVYTTEGWAGIKVLEKKLFERNKVDAEGLMAFLKGRPVKLDQWNYTVLLFNFTKKMLGLVIRESLIRVEELSAQSIHKKLHFTYTEIVKAWGNYDVLKKETRKKSDSLLSGHDVIETSTSYYLGDRKLSKDIFDLLKFAAKERTKFMAFMTSYTAAQDRVSRAAPTEWAEPNTYDSDLKKLKELSDLKSASEQYLDALSKLIAKQHPMALLIVDVLAEKFEQPDMENLLGATIDGLRSDIETLIKTIRPDDYFVKQIIPFTETNDTIKDILGFHIPPDGLEAAIAEKAIARFKDKSGFSMLNDSALIQLFDHQTIPMDSVEFIAGQHYLLHLVYRLDQIAADEKKNIEFWKAFQKTAAALSLAAFMTPPGAAFSPLFRGGAAIAGIALTVHTVSTITGSLEQNNKLLRNALLAQEDASVAALGKLGDAISLRKDIYDGITEQLAIELLNTLVLGSLPGFRHAILASGYYNDIETLMGVDEDDE